MDGDATYQRDAELRRRLNAFLCDALRLPEADYYEFLDLQKLLGLKSVLSDINNALTLRLTLGFVDWVSNALEFDAVTKNRIRIDVLRTKPSTNGFDVHCTHQRGFVAEVKCNVPINGGTIYGAAQKNGIINDIEALHNGKSKAASVDPSALKFMVFLDLPAVRSANNHLKSSNSRISKEFRILSLDEIPNDPKVVYGVHVPLGA